MNGEDLSSFSMDELFRAEAETQCTSLSNDLLALENAENSPPLLESLMRAAHSLKGAARIIGRDDAVQVAHVMEDCFVKSQKSGILPGAPTIDVLLEGVDLLRKLAGVSEGTTSQAEIEKFMEACKNPPQGKKRSRRAADSAPTEASGPAPERRDVRLDSERLNNLLGLAGQAMVASQLKAGEMSPLRAAFRHLQSLLSEVAKTDDETRRAALFRRAMAATAAYQSLLAEASERRDLHERRLSQLCSRIYHETLTARLRPFGDITPGIRRLARDLARDLGKEVEIEVTGEAAEVDRDLLDRLDGVLAHLVRNALDHGIELPGERQAAGKPARGHLYISARHQGGWLVLSVGDDGRGLEVEAIKAAILRRGLASEENVAQLSEAELSEFLLLPGFSLSDKVTEISGRGVGLDAVRVLAYGAGGSLRLSRGAGGGFLCEMILPVSLSLVRALIVKIAGERCAVPLARVERVLQVPREELQAVTGRQYIFLEDERVEILSAAEVLELGEAVPSEGILSLMILPGRQGKIGLVVDEFVGMRELSLQRIDAQVGRLQDVSAMALMEDGEPVIMLDLNDLAITAANFSSGSRYRPMYSDERTDGVQARRILVVDDSLTVRELERKLLASRGYVVETAVDGADAWNALRAGRYDLLVTDIDMPRLDGIELVKLVRADAKLQGLPVIVVSYKDREEDRARGLEAGADFYLPKSSYEDESLLKATRELIGEALAP